MADLAYIVLVLIVLVILFLICSFLYGLLLKFAGPGSEAILINLAQVVLYAW